MAGKTLKRTVRTRKELARLSLAELKRADPITQARWAKQIQPALDRLQTQLEQFAQEMRAKLAAVHPKKEIDLVEKLQAGLKSSKRNAWLQLEAAIGEGYVCDFVDLLVAMPRPKPMRGRPAGKSSYAKDDHDLFEKMHIMVERGTSVRSAAFVVLPEAKGNGVPDSILKRLERGYSIWRSRGR